MTRASIEIKRIERHGSGRPRVVSDFLAATGFSEQDVAVLVAARLLVRVGRDGLSPESVYAWAAGHRPELLASPLLASTAAGLVPLDGEGRAGVGGSHAALPIAAMSSRRHD